MEKKSNVEKGSIDYNQVKEAAKKIFQEMDWGQLNLIAKEFQIRAGITEPKTIMPDYVVFTNIANNGFLQVLGETFTVEDGKIKSKGQFVNGIKVEVDVNNILGMNYNSISELEEKLKDYFIHEFAHLLSHKPTSIFSENLENQDNPSVIVRGGVQEDKAFGEFEKIIRINGRLNEILTEITASYIQSKYEPKIERKHQRKITAYRLFVDCFNIFLIALNRETGVPIDQIAKSFWWNYFNDIPVITEEIFEELPENVRALFKTSFFEFSKEDTNYEVNREIFHKLIDTYNISESELDSMRESYN